jgi:hypothetical protein
MAYEIEASIRVLGELVPMMTSIAGKRAIPYRVSRIDQKFCRHYIRR